MGKGKYGYWLQPENLVRLRGWALDGLTDEQIAKNMGVNVSTLYDWKKKYSQFSEALKEGKDTADREVENALYKAARGYTVEEVTRELNPKEGTLVVTKVVTKHIQPSVTAQIFWLKNRKPQCWRDKQDLSVEGAMPVVIHDDLDELED